MTDRQALQHLAVECGVQTDYLDSRGQLRVASPQALVAVLRALDVPLQSENDAQDALRDVLERKREQVCPPVLIAWQGVLQPFTVNLPHGQESAGEEVRIELESGQEVRALLEPVDAASGSPAFSLPASVVLPWGIHCLSIGSSHPGVATIISAPERCFGCQPGASRDLGLFMPLHALHDALTWGVGDFRALGELQRWAASLGCTRIATLPLLACFLDEPFDPSPYLPVSRLFWNELFLDLTGSPDLENSALARELLSSATLATRVGDLREKEHVDYRGTAALKRQVLDLLATEAFSSPVRMQEIESSLKQEPLLDQYARFRAVTEKLGPDWTSWPDSEQGTRLPFSGDDLPAWRRHVYAQLLLRKQIGLVAEAASPASLALDLPIGVHPAGFDAWHWREEFVEGVSAGAPPDLFFADGQNWAFRPPHPLRTRESGHHYFLKAITSHMWPAGLLRVDHVMSLHRLFWIPAGFPASQGVYVRYASEELYALLCLESHRSRTRIVGENLGTVPPEVGIEMKRRGLLSTTVAQFELHADATSPIGPLPQQTLATINTHDTPPWKAYWSGRDVDLRRSLGLLDATEEPLRERSAIREAVAASFHLPASPSDETAAKVLELLLRKLASGPALEILVNLEDLWLEDRPQNVPGVPAYPSWTRRATLSLEQIQSNHRITGLLSELGALRREGPPQAGEGH